MTFKAFKQARPMECLACVAAMATRTTPEEFVAFLKKEYPLDKIEAPYNDICFQRYLLEFKLIVGAGLGIIGKNHAKEWHGMAVYPLRGRPGLVSVTSLSKIEHALYWDGERLWDPDPDTPDGLSPNDYNIVGWWPIVRVDV